MVKMLLKFGENFAHSGSMVVCILTWSRALGERYGSTTLAMVAEAVQLRGDYASRSPGFGGRT